MYELAATATAIAVAKGVECSLLSRPSRLGELRSQATGMGDYAVTRSTTKTFRWEECCRVSVYTSKRELVIFLDNSYCDVSILSATVDRSTLIVLVIVPGLRQLRIQLNLHQNYTAVQGTQLADIDWKTQIHSVLISVTY